MTVLPSFERKYLFPLVEHGYFANIFFNEKDTVCVDCTVYFSDHDSETQSSTVVRMDPAGPFLDEGKCVACNQAPTNGDTRAWTSRSIMCPACRFWTKPHTLTLKHYRANFKIIPNEPAEFVCAITKYWDPMSEHMIQCISEALTPAYAEYFDEEEKAAWFGQNTTQSLLQSQEAAQEASIRTEQAEFSRATSDLANYLN